MPRFFVNRMLRSMDIPCTVHRLNEDGSVYWQHHTIKSWWVPACEYCIYQSRQDIERAVSQSILVELKGE